MNTHIVVYCKKMARIFLFVFLIVSFVVPQVYAQDSGAVDARRTELERELAELEKRIESQREILRGKQRESVSLERDIAILDAQISKARLEIRARDITVANLGEEIVGKTTAIGGLDNKLERERKSLGALLQRTRELEQTSLVEAFFSNDTLSGFFNDFDTFEAIEEGLQESFDELRSTREVTVNEREVLEEKRLEEVELRTLQELEEQRLREAEQEKEDLLEITKGEEAVYQEILQGQERSAAEIRAELFTLRGSSAIPFGEALDYANFASSKTGVRPAFVLGILAQESNLGEFLGSGTWLEDMHPTRDKPVFEQITKALGLNPDTLPVSKAPWYGWGGAMGPAQFIPSTWVCYGGFINTNTGDCNNAKRDYAWSDFWQGPWIYSASEDRVRQLLEKSSPTNPWEPKDAIMASSLLLKENGADDGGYDAERLAALRYFAGWTNATKPSYAFYGDDVMALAAKYQAQIDILQGS